MFIWCSKIPREQAVSIARDEAECQGWPWRGEGDVMWSWTCWKAKSNRGAIGSHMWIEIHRQTGAILAKKYIPR